MSWSTDVYEIPCPCGKGMIKIITKTNDDWNQSDKPQEIILCAECRAKVEKEKKRKDARNKRFVELRSQAISYFKDYYLEKWISYFKNTKTKKDVWNIVTKLDIENCNLNKFYSKYKSITIEKYIMKLANNLENIPKIMNGLDIHDLELQDLLDEPLKINQEIENERKAQAYLHYKRR